MQEKYSKKAKKSLEKIKAMSAADIFFLVIFPAIYTYLRGKPDKMQAMKRLLKGKETISESILPLITLADMVVLLIVLCIQHKVHFLCIITWLAVNVYSWLDMLFYKQEDD